MAKGPAKTIIPNFIKETLKNIELVEKKVSFEIFKRVVLRTPVKSGRARGGWHISINKREYFFDDDFVDKNGGTVLQTVLQVLNTLKPGKESTIFFTNNVPYILFLEDGDSTQAPRGMVRVSITQFVNAVNRAARTV